MFEGVTETVVEMQTILTLGIIDRSQIILSIDGSIEWSRDKRVTARRSWWLRAEVCHGRS